MHAQASALKGRIKKQRGPRPEPGHFSSRGQGAEEDKRQRDEEVMTREMRKPRGPSYGQVKAESQCTQTVPF